MHAKLSPQKFQQKILAWFDQYGRKTLPWQQNISPYRVWISEIMLQQTQVQTVIPYYQRFMQRFPSPTILATAEMDEVLHYWTGLGYYARARNIHKAAKIIVRNFAGQFPQDFSAIIALPGIGHSTAGAICAIALQQHHAILDGNVKRVLTRFAAISGWPGTVTINQKLWHLAKLYTPIDRIADYTQAIMDLGATVCKRARPSCEHCPLHAHCIAHQQHKETSYPTKKPKKSLPTKQTIMLLIKNIEAEWLLEKRPANGIWGGLWLFPQCQQMEDIASWCVRQDVNAQQQTLLPKFRHTFSHYHLEIQPVLIKCDFTAHKVMDTRQFIWYKQQQKIGLAAPVKKLLRQLQEKQ